MNTFNKLNSLQRPIDWRRGNEVMSNVGQAVNNFAQTRPPQEAMRHKKRMVRVIDWFLELRDSKKYNNSPLGSPVITNWLIKGYPYIIELIDTIQNSMRDGIILKMFLGCTVGLKEWLLDLYQKQYLITQDRRIEQYYFSLSGYCKENVVSRIKPENDIFI